MQIEFSDKMVSYDTFMNDLATRVAEKLAMIREQPERVSQRQAYSMFGRANVERWLADGKLHPCKRPGKMEYQTSELRRMQSVQQDYFRR